MAVRTQGECEVCGETLGSRDGGPWVCFQSLWIVRPGDNQRATSVERENGDRFVACHVHCMRMLVQGEMAPSEPKKKAKAVPRGNRKK